MTEKLPPNILALFAPRPQLRYLPPTDVSPGERATPRVSGIAAYLQFAKTHDNDYKPTQSLEEQRLLRKEEKQRKHVEKLREMRKRWNPDEDRNIVGDPYKTIFIGRLSYDTKESEIEREFIRYGPIDRIRIVRDKDSDKPRGYAFVVFERERDLKAAYRASDRLYINGRKVVVDVERGRTVKDWYPRRLGGGLGGRHYTAEPKRFERGSRYRGGSSVGRGGFRGSFRGASNSSTGSNGPRGFSQPRRSRTAGLGYERRDRASSPKRRRYY
ncbi:U1 snRNP-associated protein Usp101 [Schizosaccharomyces japonicus yFS275]|uniref:U1 snRNP-associated protein Usp101 n=1 Tax=Schizosaccharomyces japonicus (strain yFS275 / FY16936) TaxID=402676 RepID=B6K8D1_SCHJY|nr:U1 snRNP-associated protein Usp101 [Schizosaccharomyces japonicus yFS275]EEB09785.1 U1 snRNP-associated protein Usp101 [Schizosaccharomyces japonicus yFS275]